MLLVVLIGALVLLGVALLLSLAGGTLEDEPVDAADAGLPTGRPLVSDDVARLRFRTTIRGYRMEDVDAAMERLESALREAESRGAATRASSASSESAPRSSAPRTEGDG
jgi:DivIVA domain-containing protein